MSYDDDQYPAPRRRFRNSTLLIVLVALVPTCLAGWLVWQAMNGPGDDNAPQKVLPLPSPTATATTRPAKSPSKTPATSHPAASKSPTPSTPADNKPPTGKGPLAGKVVVIDPGHNPNNYNHTRDIARLVNIGNSSKECDTTGTSTNGGYSEARFTLDVSHRLRSLLEAQGATVKFTQDGDRSFGPCVDERARIGNKAKADAVVSVHGDGSAAGNRGFHVILPALVRGGAADTSPIVASSHDLGVRIAGKFVQDTGSAPSNYIGGGTGLDTRSDLGGLNLSTVPKVFIECGNMRDPKDAALMTSGSWRQKAAQGIADGIISFLHQ
ncbi:N-acetylmuramoyl-L-alanine amidase [Streptomyces sp. NBC_01465]|uniref:N-acetylmuramoyl-L-alanine amidase n=1 Tax=Streptomyces sp. NBC_01465 TaxID=2903878 RepID=UPI002E2FA605|nr:N-acetylmuramoyl-L-alanine amidase [Streptomyces sp. NBC_01465]